MKNKEMHLLALELNGEIIEAGIGSFMDDGFIKECGLLILTYVII